MLNLAKNILQQSYNDLIKKNNNTAVLILEDGKKIFGTGFGYPSIKVGELCFNTAMTGYQEIITDPSYNGQIITFTFPHIGNVGTNLNDYESSKSFASGIITREPPPLSSNWRSENEFGNWLIKMKLTGIYGIDTRFLTKYIRDKNAPTGLICFNPNKSFNFKLLNKTLESWPRIKGANLIPNVSSKRINKWRENSWNVKKNVSKNKKFHVIAFDFGIKNNILRNLYDLGLEVTVVPFESSIQKIKDLKPDGIFLSNGPGDPLATYNSIKENFDAIIKIGLPIFGICIGHQLLALSFGAKTEKMEQGHRGGNHPVLELSNKTVEITSQNHGFNVVENNLPSILKVTHRSLFDNSIEGLEHKLKPIFSVQYHPEASPGPHDSKYLFKKFYTFIENRKL